MNKNVAKNKNIKKKQQGYDPDQEESNNKKNQHNKME
jgi:hypothetical protein